MPIWRIWTDSEKDASELVSADAMHHGHVGDLYFSLQVGENEYTICQAYAPHEWDKVKLLELTETKTTNKQNKQQGTTQ